MRGKSSSMRRAWPTTCVARRDGVPQETRSSMGLIRNDDPPGAARDVSKKWPSAPRARAARGTHHRMPITGMMPAFANSASRGAPSERSSAAARNTDAGSETSRSNTRTAATGAPAGTQLRTRTSAAAPRTVLRQPRSTCTPAPAREQARCRPTPEFAPVINTRNGGEDARARAAIVRNDASIKQASRASRRRVATIAAAKRARTTTPARRSI